MENCDLDVKLLSELSIAELSELNLDRLPLHALFAIEEHATGINYNELLVAVQNELQRRTLPKAAKIAAGQIIVAALHHHVMIGARGECREPYAWDFKLDHPLWTRELELLPFAFSDDDDNEMYDDVRAYRLADDHVLRRAGPIAT